MTQESFPEYSVMVKNLFKPIEGVGASMMHATIGFAGEVGELARACSYKNIIEECGDIEFYLEAVYQQLPQPAFGNPVQAPALELSFAQIAETLQLTSTEMLDYAKKVWVYGGAKGKRDGEIFGRLCQARHALCCFYDMIGTTITHVHRANQVKLLGVKGVSAGRYESGKYSDEQALARKDKESEGKTPFVRPARNFIGQKS